MLYLILTAALQAAPSASFYDGDVAAQRLKGELRAYAWNIDAGPPEAKVCLSLCHMLAAWEPSAESWDPGPLQAPLPCETTIY